MDISVTTFNVWVLNPLSRSAIRRLIRDSADLLVVCELRHRDYVALSRELEETHHTAMADTRFWSRIGIFSRIPFASVHELREGPLTNRPQLAVLLDTDPKIALYGLHFSVPFGPRLRHLRDQQISQIATRIDAQDYPTIVAGDFNAGSSFDVFKEFMKRTQLRSHDRSKPIWPSLCPLLDLDHILYSRHFLAQEYGRLGFGGSDHRPVKLRLTMSTSRVSS